MARFFHRSFGYGTHLRKRDQLGEFTIALSITSSRTLHRWNNLNEVKRSNKPRLERDKKRT